MLSFFISITSSLPYNYHLVIASRNQSLPVWTKTHLGHPTLMARQCLCFREGVQIPQLDLIIKAT